uniref:Stannin n=1 Tax=Gopherus agassizii TaxID=38772 RepID=A0A452HRD3_9SAUR
SCRVTSRRCPGRVWWLRSGWCVAGHTPCVPGHRAACAGRPGRSAARSARELGGEAAAAALPRLKERAGPSPAAGRLEFQDATSDISKLIARTEEPSLRPDNCPEILIMSIMDHSPTTGVVTVIVILIAIAALGALILGCWCYLRLQRISQSEDEESIVGEGETKEPFLLVQYSAKGPCVERKAKLTPNGTEIHS